MKEGSSREGLRATSKEGKGSKAATNNETGNNKDPLKTVKGRGNKELIKTVKDRDNKGLRKTAVGRDNNVLHKIGKASPSNDLTSPEATGSKGRKTDNLKDHHKTVAGNLTGRNRDLAIMKKKNNELIK